MLLYSKKRGSSKVVCRKQDKDRDEREISVKKSPSVGIIGIKTKVKLHPTTHMCIPNAFYRGIDKWCDKQKKQKITRQTKIRNRSECSGKIPT